MKNIILLVLSLGFYTWGEKQMVILILLSSLVDYSSGLIINSGKKKIGLVLSIVFNLSILIYFKYSNFIISNINKEDKSVPLAVEKALPQIEVLLNYKCSFTYRNQFLYISNNVLYYRCLQR